MWIILGVVCLIAVGGIIPLVFLCIKKCSRTNKVGQTSVLSENQKKSSNILPIRTIYDNESNNIRPISDNEEKNPKMIQLHGDMKERHLNNLPPSNNRKEKISNHLPPISNEKKVSKHIQQINDLGQTTTLTSVPLPKNRNKLPPISKFPLIGSQNAKITAESSSS